MLFRSSLCQRTIWLENGKIQKNGDTNDVVNLYINKHFDNQNSKMEWTNENAPGNEKVKILSAEIADANDPQGTLFINRNLEFKIQIQNLSINNDFNISVHLFTLDDVHVMNIASPVLKPEKEFYTFKCIIPENFLNDISYSVRIMIIESSKNIFTVDNILAFEMHEDKRDVMWFGKWKGVVRPQLQWTIE